MQIIQIGNPIINNENNRVNFENKQELDELIDAMILAMREENLVGLAANQIGINKKIFIVEIRNTDVRSFDNGKELMIFINPKIINYSQETNIEYEGCGSVAYAKLFGTVERSNEVTIQYQDRNGNQKVRKLSGFLARVIQHEYDHINGITFIEKITDIKKCLSSGEFKKINNSI